MHHPIIFFQNNVLLIFSGHLIHVAYLAHGMFVTTFYSSPSDWKWLLLHFSNMDTSDKHMFTFLNLLQLIKCCHNWSLKKLKQYIKETLFTIILFNFFMCDDLSFINTTQNALKPSKKMFQFPGWMRKNFIPWNFSWMVSAEKWDASCFKKGLLEKQQSVPNTCNISLLKKIFFQNLTDAFFKYL